MTDPKRMDPVGLEVARGWAERVTAFVFGDGDCPGRPSYGVALTGSLATIPEPVLLLVGEVEHQAARADAAEAEAAAYKKQRGDLQEEVRGLRWQGDTLRAALMSLAEGIQRVAVAAGWPPEMPVEETDELAESVTEMGQRAAKAERERDESRAFIKRTTDALSEMFVEILGEDAPGGGPLESKAARCIEAVASLRERGCYWEHAANEWQAATSAEWKRANVAESEVARLRSRVPVEASDVETRGLTRKHVDAWLLQSEWQPVNTPIGPGWTLDDNQSLVARDGAGHIAATIDSIAFYENRSPWDILAEMAAMEVPK